MRVISTEEFKRLGERKDIIVPQMYLVHGTVAEFFPEDEYTSPAFTMSDEVFCNVSDIAYDAHRLLRSLIETKEKCHVFGVAFHAAGDSYRIDPLIIQSDAHFLRRWEANPCHYKEQFRQFAEPYHAALREYQQALTTVTKVQ
jgi:hypothetical protein